MMESKWYNFWKFAAKGVAFVEFILVILAPIYGFLFVEGKTGAASNLDIAQIPKEEGFQIFVTILMVGCNAGMSYLLTVFSLFVLCCSFISKLTKEKRSFFGWMWVVSSLSTLIGVPFMLSPFESMLNVIYAILGYRIISYFIILNWLTALSGKKQKLQKAKVTENMSRGQVHIVVQMHI